jgi:hypothetical protein
MKYIITFLASHIIAIAAFDAGVYKLGKFHHHHTVTTQQKIDAEKQASNPSNKPAK